MKTIDIALKDLLRSLRGAWFLAMGFIVPLLVSGIFYVAFGSLASGEGGFTVPTTQVQLANLDRGSAGVGSFSAGATLSEFLHSPNLADLVEVTDAPDAAAARAAVDGQLAGVAVIIPAGFTAAIVAPGGQASIELYSDPTLTLGPGIVESIVRQFADGFAGSKIAAEVAAAELSTRGAPPDAETLQSIALAYATWATRAGAAAQSGDSPLLDMRSPAGIADPAPDLRTTVIAVIMAGMTVFYLFFTGAAGALPLLQEEESGTLPRLFTTPTPATAVLGGRLLATLVTLTAQLVILLILANLIFGIDWGKPLPLVASATALVILSASFGLFLTSLLKNTRQAGFVYGGAMTLMGMLGMMDIFTAGNPAATNAFSTVSLIVPQGWAVRAWKLLLEGGGWAALLPPLAVMFSLSIIFFLLGLLRFRRRFA